MPAVIIPFSKDNLATKECDQCGVNVFVKKNLNPELAVLVFCCSACEESYKDEHGITEWETTQLVG